MVRRCLLLRFKCRSGMHRPSAATAMREQQTEWPTTASSSFHQLLQQRAAVRLNTDIGDDDVCACACVCTCMCECERRDATVKITKHVVVMCLWTNQLTTLLPVVVVVLSSCRSLIDATAEDAGDKAGKICLYTPVYNDKLTGRAGAMSRFSHHICFRFRASDILCVLYTCLKRLMF